MFWIYGIDVESFNYCSSYTQNHFYGIDLESLNCCSGYTQNHFYGIDLESLNCCSGYTQDHDHFYGIDLFRIFELLQRLHPRSGIDLGFRIFELL